MRMAIGWYLWDLPSPLQQQEFTLGFFYYEWRDNQRSFQEFTFERGVNECNLTESIRCILNVDR